MLTTQKRMATRHRQDSGPDWNSHQRAAMMTLFLFQGSKLSNFDVAKICGMTRRGAEKMMKILSATLPIVDVDGKWEWMRKGE